MTHCIVGITASFFAIVFLSCEFSWANHIHSHRRLRRSFVSIGYDIENDEHIQQCHTLCREYSCKYEYIQSRARYILSCIPGDLDDFNRYPCAQHRNGTLCEALIDKYFGFGSLSSRRYNPNSDQSCSYSECSSECSVILQQLKDTWGCCFHAMAEAQYFELNRNLEGFTTKNQSHNYWRLCRIQPPEKCHYDINEVNTDTAECTTREQLGHLSSEYHCIPLPQFLSEAKSCAYLYYRASALCEMKDGKRCHELLFFSNYTDKLFAKAEEDCSRTIDICSLGCKSTLQFLREHIGCCLHIDNGTNPDSTYSILLRYGLWRACGIEPPGQCSSIITQLQSGSSFPAVSSSSSVVVIAFLIITLSLL